MMKAKVKWFDDSKGYGFLVTESNKEVFVHWTNIIGDMFKTLAEGQEVELELYEGKRGYEAKNVKKL